jgi:hypothetical protein
MRFRRWVLLVVLALVPGMSEAASPEPQDSSAVPRHILESGIDLFESRAGTTFVSRFAVFDSTASGVSRAGKPGVVRYRLVFRVLVPELGIDEPAVVFTLDSAGNVPSPRDSLDIPDCLAHPEECALLVGRAEAISIADRHGMPGSPDDWDARLVWRFEHGFVWLIMWPPMRLGTAHVTIKEIDGGSGEVVADRSYLRSAD